MGFRSIAAHKETIQALSTSPDSALVASGCSQGILHIHDIEDGQLLATQDSAHDMGVTAAEFSPNSRKTRTWKNKLSEVVLNNRAEYLKGLV
jgi:WD40 repeat protein